MNCRGCRVSQVQIARTQQQLIQLYIYENKIHSDIISTTDREVHLSDIRAIFVNEEYPDQLNIAFAGITSEPMGRIVANLSTDNRYSIMVIRNFLP